LPNGDLVIQRPCGGIPQVGHVSGPQSRFTMAYQQLFSEIIGVSVDSQYSHLAWINTPRKEGGLGGKVNFPLVADLTKKISVDYDVLVEETGFALRGLFIINKQGVVVQITKVHTLPYSYFPNSRLSLERPTCRKERR